MTGRDGYTYLSLLRDRHADGCEKDEQVEVGAVPFGAGFAVLALEWCEGCGACDYELVDTMQPDPAEVAKLR